MKILYVGGLYQEEFSLFKEAENNANLEVFFCTCDLGLSFKECIDVVRPQPVFCRQNVDKIKSTFKPDLTIFRNWTPSEMWVDSGEVFWHQELFVTTDSGKRIKENTFPTKQGVIIANKSRIEATAMGHRWLPYCVSKYWGKIEPNPERGIPILMATNIPNSSDAFFGPDMKIRSIDILLKPIIEWRPELVSVCAGFHGNLEAAPYLIPCIKPSYKFLDTPKILSRVKIYISPTAIWHDAGHTSYKFYEAFSSGCLIMTNNYVGIEDVFGKDGENLLYASTPEESLDKVRYYLDHDKEREEISERGRQFVLEKFGWEQHLTRFLSEIRGC